MVGMVGRDVFGNTLREALIHDGVSIKPLREATDGTSTGTAQILVNGRGENMIIITAGANGKLTPTDVQAAESDIAAAAVVMVQLEVPLETTREALRLARAHEVFSILNPAPAPRGGLDQELLSLASLVCPNETELAVLTQKPAKTLSEIEAAAHRLRGMGAARVLVTLGERGTLLVTEKDGEDHVLLTPSSTVEKVVDTSGAGDCFIGSLAAYLSSGMALPQAVSSACELASISVGRAGTQISYPYKHELPERLQLFHGL
ncbi:hypothetical protein NSK_002402 [Nannochloropsis salina CCMP1776]|uniref:Carbohydrate kinase PfkB domain-containing protein n=1 Tax=Nannochloropsis salina CCMP1776 TaxID=1027361 RepID=A0A4D9D5C4_9STRA|nr:hypothetical protein NSK_002402 [Nannochloropsis salina CCMP1776]|eukprot:TFJ86194.1 hypothetical protein NSK_002402 [Nannochloropsis salina CCMP1776]